MARNKQTYPADLEAWVKQCMDCLKVRSLDEFKLHTTTRTGKRYWYPRCHPCRKADDRARAADTRRRLRLGLPSKSEEARQALERELAAAIKPRPEETIRKCVVCCCVKRVQDFDGDSTTCCECHERYLRKQNRLELSHGAA